MTNLSQGYIYNHYELSKDGKNIDLHSTFYYIYAYILTTISISMIYNLN